MGATQAWTAAEGALPLGWHVAGVWRFQDIWLALGEGPDFDNYARGWRRFAEQALHRLSDRLRERHVGSTSSDAREPLALCSLHVWPA